MKRRLIVTLLVLLLVSCAKPVQEQEFAFSVAPSKLTILQTGVPVDTIVHMENMGDDNLSREDIVWNSSDDTIVTVDPQGRLFAYQNGVAQVNAKLRDKVVTIDVEVDTSHAPLTGTVSYEDKLYSLEGFYSSNSNPIRHAAVVLLDENGLVVDRTASADDGSYIFDRFLPAVFSVEVVSSSVPGTEKVRVTNTRGRPYRVRKPGIVDSPTVDIHVSDMYAGAFNALDVYMTAQEFAQTQIGVTPPDLSVFWYPGNLDGTYYCNGYTSLGCEGGAGIYLLSESLLLDEGDNDEFDDDVLLHEYGHFLMETLSRDESPGNCHVSFDNQQDLRLSWSEGWASYVSSSVKQWMSTYHPQVLSSSAVASRYIDTFFSGGSLYFRSIDYADPDANLLTGEAPDTYYYASNEVAITNILWNLEQTLPNGFIDVWGVVSSDDWKAPGRNANLELFWDLMINPAVGNVTPSVIEPAFLYRGVRYQEDAYEPDNIVIDATSLMTGVSTTHTLYRSDGVADEDWYSVTLSAGNSYKVATSGLRNGTDTKLWVYHDGDLVTPIAENDDSDPQGFLGSDAVCGSRPMNSPTGLASSVEFVAEQSGTYFIKVSTTDDPQPWVFAGRYGTYEIVINQQ